MSSATPELGVPRILDVGNCDPDHAAIKKMLGALPCVLDRVMHVEDALAALRTRSYALVLVNRLIFADGSDGLPLIERMQTDAVLRRIPVMMVSNFPEAQDRAVAAGAQRGFGKGALEDPRTIAMIRGVMGQATHGP